MPTIVATHEITKGEERWLASPKRAEALGALGVTWIRTFANPDHPTQGPRRRWSTTASCPRR